MEVFGPLGSGVGPARDRKTKIRRMWMSRESDEGSAGRGLVRE